MATTPAVTWIPLSSMAIRLKISWARAWRIALEGQVRAEQRGNRWFVVEADVAKLVRKSAVRASGRRRRAMNAQ